MSSKSPRKKRNTRDTSREVCITSERPIVDRAKPERIKFSEVDRTETLPKILQLVHARTGHDFSQYKTSTMLRRIQRRQQVYHLDTIAEYLELLSTRPEEVEALFQQLLVSVTCFFRDPEAYVSLQDKIIPALMKARTAGEPLRAWVAGCATGEEAYSLAMLFLEAFSEAKMRPQVQIFATDIDREALSVARRGRYPQDIAASVSKERLKRFFTREAGGYRVKDELRGTVRFAEHDIIRDAPFGGMHLISCRNVMIYLERLMQGRVYEIFHYALKPEGYLWLGPSESIEGVNDLFAVTDKKQRIFQRRPQPRSGRSALVQQVVARDLVARGQTGRASTTSEASLGQLHERLVLSNYSPPSVIINDNFDIIHTVGDVSPYLTIPAGDPTHNLMKIARKGLRMALRGALHQVFNAQKESRIENLRVQSRDSDQVITLVVRPLLEPPLVQPHALVVFERQRDAAPIEALPVAESPHGVDPVIDQLEEELQQARRQLQATIEAYETSNEELQSSNEELRSMNEELQSATEELEAGKEEFQSMNEELSAVNQTLKGKIEELSRANSDLRNFLTATDIGTMFLDRELCVIRYTPRIKDVFNIISSDKGRPLPHLTHTLDYPGLEADARRVLDHLEVIEREVSSSQGRWYLVRILPYRTVEEQIGGVVFTLVDITERKHLEQELRFDADILARIADAVIAMDDTGHVTYLNAAACTMYGVSEAEVMGRVFSDFVNCVFVEQGREIQCQCASRDRRQCQGEHIHGTRDGRQIPVDVSVSDLTNNAGEVIGSLSVIRDISERKRVLQALEDSENRLRRMTDAVPGAVYKMMQSAEGRRSFLFMSRGCMEVLGLTSEQLTADMESFYSQILSSDLSALQSTIDESARTLQPFLSEFRLKMRDGQTRWITMRAVPHPAPNGNVIWNGFLINSTEQRKREDFLSSIYTGVESLIAVVDVSEDGEFRVADVNPAYDRMMARMNLNFRGRTFRELQAAMPESFYNPLILHYRQCLATGSSVQYERKIEVDGSTEWFLTRLSPLRDAQGRIFRIVAMSTIITETKRHEEEQLRASKLEALGVLAGGIAHDFNNIIMGISLNLDLLLHEMDPDDSLLELVRESSYATTRAGELSRRLLVFAKGGKPVKQIADLKPALRSVVDFALTGSNLKADYQIDPELECVDADIGQISQVFDNLVINAREACRDGGALEIRAHNIDVGDEEVASLKSGRYVRVQIQDHGAGIPPDIIGKIFDPYFTTKPGGNGIGLATCYTTLKNHDGTILVESTVGHGSTFSIYLPVAVEPGDFTPATESAARPATTYRLLLIDDDSLILSTMSRALRLHGYEVTTAAEGGRGSQLYREAKETGAPFDYVLLDANIPGGLGGEAALRVLKDIDPEVRVILCSGYSASNLLSDWEALGFQGRLQKPFSVYDVSNLLQQTA